MGEQGNWIAVLSTGGSLISDQFQEEADSKKCLTIGLLRQFAEKKEACIAAYTYQTKGVTIHSPIPTKRGKFVSNAEFEIKPDFRMVHGLAGDGTKIEERYSGFNILTKESGPIRIGIFVDDKTGEIWMDICKDIPKRRGDTNRQD